MTAVPRPTGCLTGSTRGLRASDSCVVVADRGRAPGFSSVPSWWTGIWIEFGRHLCRRPRPCRHRHRLPYLPVGPGRPGQWLNRPLWSMPDRASSRPRHGARIGRPCTYLHPLATWLSVQKRTWCSRGVASAATLPGMIVRETNPPRQVEARSTFVRVGGGLGLFASRTPRHLRIPHSTRRSHTVRRFVAKQKGFR